jgi:hypothetical protein
VPGKTHSALIVAAGSSTRSSMKWEINDEIGFIVSDKVDMNYLSKIRDPISLLSISNSI